MRALTRGERTRLLASGAPALGVALDMVVALATLRPVFAARGWAHLDLGVGMLGDGFNGGNVPMASVRRGWPT